MSADNYCRWCGRKYDWLNSTASDRGYFCSKRCEVAAQRAGAAPSGRSFESRLDSCMGRGFIYFLAIALIYGVIETCTGSDKKEPNKKASPRTEQVTKTSKRETQAVRKPVKKMELVAENVPTEETPQVVSEEVPVAPSTNEEQATARQASEEQVSETSIEEQVENELEEEVEETLENTPAEEIPENTLVEESVFDAVEQMPEFPGGRDQLNKYYESNLRYPKVAIENGIQGRVIVQFIVNTDGSISDATVIRSVDPACDEEALRFINSMPHWTPGQTDGKNVRVRYTLPVTFRLI